MRHFKICTVCNKKFTSHHRDSKYCSKACWWKSPKGKRLSKIRENKSKNLKRVFAKKFLHTERGIKYYRGNRCRQELFEALDLMGVKYKKNIKITPLYKILERAINKNKIKFFRFGKPDAQVVRVEFKIKDDGLRATQLIYDLVYKTKAKVRWFPSWDSLELTLQGKQKDESLLFNSYLSYLQWCEQEMLKTIRTKAKFA